MKEQEDKDVWSYGGYWDNPGRKGQKPDIKLHEIVPKMVGPSSNREKCLDLGSAEGGFALVLKKLGYDVCATDIDERSLKILRDRGFNPVKVDVNEAFPFEDGEFNLVTCLEVIEHIKTPDNMLKEITRVLKPGGSLIISTPNINWWYLRIKHLFGKWDMHDPDHIRFYTPTRLKRIMQEYGFKVVEVKSYFVSPHINLHNIKIPPERLRTFEQHIFHNISYGFILRCHK